MNKITNYWPIQHLISDLISAKIIKSPSDGYKINHWRHWKQATKDDRYDWKWYLWRSYRNFVWYYKTRPLNRLNDLLQWRWVEHKYKHSINMSNTKEKVICLFFILRNKIFKK